MRRIWKLILVIIMMFNLVTVKAEGNPDDIVEFPVGDYKFSIDYNGGEIFWSFGVIDNKITLPNTSKLGYGLSYYMDIDNNDNKYNVGDIITVDRDIHLIAIFEEVDVFTVTLDYGDGDIKTSEVNSGGDFWIPEPTAKEGYKFLYWLNEEDSKEYEANVKFTIVSDINFKAVYEEIKLDDEDVDGDVNTDKSDNDEDTSDGTKDEDIKDEMNNNVDGDKSQKDEVVKDKESNTTTSGELKNPKTGNSYIGLLFVFAIGIMIFIINFYNKLYD